MVKEKRIQSQWARMTVLRGSGDREWAKGI